MKNFKINFINHASLFIETEFYNILTDPWFISNAFGKWYHYPSPNYDDINKIIKAANKTYTLISHGHDDHLDENHDHCDDIMTIIMMITLKATPPHHLSGARSHQKSHQKSK